VQFVPLWHLLKHGHSMIDFEEFKQLFQILKVENYPRKQWNDSTGWTMVEAMHQVVLCAIKVAVDKSLFLAVSCMR
jgi:hypothetical protein